MPQWLANIRILRRDYVSIVTFYLYDSLARLQHYSRATHLDRRWILKTVNANQKKMKCWAKHAPDNHWHKFMLVEAEIHNIRKKRIKAMEYYDRAIAAAKKQGYVNEEAVANERAAQFYLDWGRTKIAQNYLREAHYCYSQWGAIAKVKDLEERYGSLLSQTLLKDGITITQTLAAGSLIRTRSGLSLDLATVQKAYQALSREIVLEHLLKTLMELILENAGAQRGVLLLPQGDDFLIQAASEVETSKTTVLQGFLFKTILRCRLILSTMWLGPISRWCWIMRVMIHWWLMTPIFRPIVPLRYYACPSSIKVNFRASFIWKIIW